MALVHPRQEEYLIPERALARRLRARFAVRLKRDYPELAEKVDLSRTSQNWVVQCKEAGRGKSALRYLAAYVKKSAFSSCATAAVFSGDRPTTTIASPPLLS